MLIKIQGYGTIANHLQNGNSEELEFNYAVYARDILTLLNIPITEAGILAFNGYLISSDTLIRTSGELIITNSFGGG